MVSLLTAACLVRRNHCKSNSQDLQVGKSKCASEIKGKRVDRTRDILLFPHPHLLFIPTCSSIQCFQKLRLPCSRRVKPSAFLPGAYTPLLLLGRVETLHLLLQNMHPGHSTHCISSHLAESPQHLLVTAQLHCPSWTGTSCSVHLPEG